MEEWEKNGFPPFQYSNIPVFQIDYGHQLNNCSIYHWDLVFNFEAKEIDSLEYISHPLIVGLVTIMKRISSPKELVDI
jgi:hypothetical protein